MQRGIMPLSYFTFIIICSVMLLMSCSHRRTGFDSLESADNQINMVFDNTEDSETICADRNSTPITQSVDKEILLATKGLKLIDRMNRLAHSKAYLSHVTDAQVIHDEVAVITAADYSTPQEIFLIDGAAFIADTTDFISDYIREKTVRSIPTMINGLNGTQSLAATALLQVDDAFRYEGLDHTVICLFIYNSPYSVMVTYNPTEDGTVLAIASFVRFASSDSTLDTHHIADVVGSVIKSDDITVRSIDTP